MLAQEQNVLMPENTPRRRRPSNDSASDIERFLAEVDRLRRKAATDTQRAEEPEQYEEVQEVLPVERPRPAPRPQPRARRFEQGDVVEVLPVRRAPVVVDYAAPSAPSPGAAAPAAPQAVQTVKSVTGVTEAGGLTSRAVHPAAQRMLSLLQRDNIRAAIL